MTRALHVVYTPGQLRRLTQSDWAGSVAVVVDQLRATSTIVTALAEGASRIIAVEDLATARCYHQEHPETLLAGERGGEKPPDFALGNSPREYTSTKIQHRPIVLTTTNGTGALVASRWAEQVWIASFLNLQAVINQLRQLPLSQPILLVVAGTGKNFSLEDGLVLAEIAGALQSNHPLASLKTWSSQGHTSIQRRTINGRHLVQIGLGEDITFCAQLDRFNLVPRCSFEQFHRSWIASVQI